MAVLRLVFFKIPFTGNYMVMCMGMLTGMLVMRMMVTVMMVMKMDDDSTE